MGTALFADPLLTRLPERALAMPVFVMGSLLGIPAEALESAVNWVDAYVRSVNNPALAQEGSEGAAHLMELLDSACGAPRQPELLRAFTDEAHRMGCSPELITPNAVGLLTQAYEATAGLIGSTLRVLARSPDLRSQLAARMGLLEDVVRETARYDAPVQNTRRFVAESGTLAGQAVERGATIRLLAAANRDPEANPSPDMYLHRHTARAPRVHLRRGALTHARGKRSRSPSPPPRSSACWRPASTDASDEGSHLPPFDQRSHPGRSAMIAVIFEVSPRDGRRQEYLDIAASLRPLLSRIDGFISIERFESLASQETSFPLLLERRGRRRRVATPGGPPEGPVRGTRGGVPGLPPPSRPGGPELRNERAREAPADSRAVHR